MISSSFMSSEKDRLTIEISLDNPNDILTTFCVCKNKDVKHMNKTYGDLKFMTNNFEFELFSKNISLLAEDKELFTSIFEFKETKNVFLIINLATMQSTKRSRGLY